MLLDTHILIRWLERSPHLKASQVKCLESIRPENPALVASMTLWEIATLFSLGRLKIQRPLRSWLQAAVAPPLVRLIPLNAAIASEVANLPDSFHRDPGDRVIVATAKVLDVPLMTNDRAIIESGLVRTI